MIQVSTLQVIAHSHLRQQFSITVTSHVAHFTENITGFVNPDRGWYYHTETRTSDYIPLDYRGILGLRNNENYALIFRHIVLDSFRTQAIDNVTLDKIAHDLGRIRNAYFKVILRFSYTVTMTNPRNDAPKSTILHHIAQLSPILTSNSDVILAIQHGFIGTWGEGYFTDYFGDMGIISPEQQEDRQEVYNALLSSFPECTMIQVRTWQFKERLTGTSVPVPPEEAYSCGNCSVAVESRTGIHNDCFLASETDYGTWTDSAVDRPPMGEHSLYTVFGGETCNPTSSRNACPIALEELAFFHYTYLNNLYHPDVLQRWKNEGCYDTIEKRLGYRLVLVSACFPNDPLPRGCTMTFDLKIRNDGFAAPMAQRTLELILMQTEHASVTLDVNGTNVNPQFWLGNGTVHTIGGRVHLPGDMDVGNWSIFLAITESAPSLQETLEYNILFVNQPSSAQQAGRNDLLRTVSVIDCKNSTSSYCTLTEPGTSSGSGGSSGYGDSSGSGGSNGPEIVTMATNPPADSGYSNSQSASIGVIVSVTILVNLICPCLA